MRDNPDETSTEMHGSLALTLIRTPTLMLTLTLSLTLSPTLIIIGIGCPKRDSLIHTGN